MTPAARVSAAIGILDVVLDGQSAEKSLLRWSRQSRYAGSKDRAAVRDLVFDALRRRNTLADRGGASTGRGLMIGLCRETGVNPDDLFTGEAYAPDRLTLQEQVEGEVVSEDLPGWLLSLWRDSLGADAKAIGTLMGHRAPVWLRVNPLRGTAENAQNLLAKDGIMAEASPLLPSALRVYEGERRIHDSQAYRTGLVELQDLSPQLACATLPLSAGDRVLDYCAGGGGKSLALAGLKPGCQLYAYDAEPARMADLPVRAQRAGAKITICNIPKGKFDLVIADVPCSGSGTWRRTPDTKWRMTEERLQELVSIQATILDRAATFVSEGGHLAYMTCSLLDTENKSAVDAFLARNNNFKQVTSETWTPLTASDGFFLSILINN